MSVSKNPDFWRSQEVGDSKPSQPSASNAEDSSKSTPTPSDAASTPGSNEPSLTEGGQQAQASVRLRNNIPGGSGYDGHAVLISGGNTGRRSAGTGSSGTSASGPNKTPPSKASGQNGPAQNRGQTTAPAAKGNNPASGRRAAPAAGKSAGSGVTPSASSGMADRLRGAGNAPKKTAPSTGSAAKSGDAPKVLSKETGKAAAGEALKQGVKGAAKGAMTGGWAGAAKGGVAGAAAGAADKINESAARQPAGTTRGPSNKGGLFDSMGESALDKGKASLQGRYGSKSSGAAGGSAGGESALSPQQAESIAKAATTLQKEVTTTVVKKAGMAIGVVVALVYVLVMTMITTVTGPITAATTAAYGAKSTSCNDPSSSSSSSPSPSPSASPSASASSSASGSNDSGIDLASNVSVIGKVPVVAANTGDLDANPAKYGLSSNADIRSEQIKNANTIMGVSKNIGFNQQGALIGIMTALTESDLVNVSYGDTAGPNSRGLFQQRTGDGGWGTIEDVMNPSYSAQAFFVGVGGKANPGLDSVSGWDKMDPWTAAQQVQRSAFSDGSNYRSKLPQAQAIVGLLYADAASVPSVTSGKINTPKSGVNIQTTANGCGASGSGGNSSTAAGDTYPARNESYCRSSLCYAIQAADRVASGYRGECVDWAGWKLIEGTDTYGSYIPISMGDAKDWGPNAQAHGIAVDMTPRAGDAIYWTAGQGGSGASGHIGTVQSVNGTKVTIEEYNYGTAFPGDTPETGGGRYHTRTIDASNASGYIHFIDTTKSKAENKQYLIDKGILVPGHTTWPRK